MEDTPPKRREAPIGEAMAFTSRSHPQSASSGQALRQRALSEGAAPHEVLLHVRNVESDSSTNPHQRLALDKQQSLDATKSQEELVEIDVQQPSSSETRNKKKMEEGTSNHPLEVARRKASSSTTRRQGASSGQAVNQQKCPFFPSFLRVLLGQRAFLHQPIDDSDSPRIEEMSSTPVQAAGPHELEKVLNSLPEIYTTSVQAAGPQELERVVNPLQEIYTTPVQAAGPQELESVPNSLLQLEHVQPCSSETNEVGKRLKRDLLRAAYRGDWPHAKAILDDNPALIGCPITKEKDTVLHNAVAAKQTTFVTELLKLELMTWRDLEVKSIYKFTALHVAAETGDVKMAKAIVEKNDKLPVMNDLRNVKPLLIAANLGHRDMVSYLLYVTPFERLTTDERFAVLLATISTDLYDIALEIAEKMDPKSATAGNPGDGIKDWWTALEELARKQRLTNGNGSQLSFWKRCSNSWFKGIYTKASTLSTSAHQLVEKLLQNVDCELSSNLALSTSLFEAAKLGNVDCELSSNLALTSLFEAAKAGNVEFIILLTRTYPDLIWQVDTKKQSLFHIAILYRQKSVFSLIYEIGNNNMNSLASNTNKKSKENMLHLAARLPPQDRLNIVAGPALQMQQELLWFKEIKNIVPQSYVNKKNSKGKTPEEIFTKTHEGLQTNGEKWMKDTANYCMLVATLIATVVFAAALTVPGGNNETGTPIFLRSNWFMVFFISDAIALFSSSISIVVFLSILTSRYTHKDFMKSLPEKLVFGLATLFISMAGMMVAFSAICFLVYDNASAWTPVVVITSASIPVTLFVLLHRRVWFETFCSTYNSAAFLSQKHDSKFRFRPYESRLWKK